jgi:hypothetical protein
MPADVQDYDLCFLVSNECYKQSTQQYIQEE